MGNCLGELRIITTKEAVDFLLPKHYSGRKPNISRAFGWYIDDELVAVCTFGKPASRTLCSGIMKGEYSECVYELNRLCRIETFNGQLSKFVGACLREVAKNNWIVVSYADTGMKHNGYIYQATNFLYTGATKERTDKYTEGNKHSRHYDNSVQDGRRKVRTSKHRYVYFATNNKCLKRDWSNKLAYPIVKYPKDKNEYYVLGEYFIPQVRNENGN